MDIKTMQIVMGAVLFIVFVRYAIKTVTALRSINPDKKPTLKWVRPLCYFELSLAVLFMILPIERLIHSDFRGWYMSILAIGGVFVLIPYTIVTEGKHTLFHKKRGTGIK